MSSRFSELQIFLRELGELLDGSIGMAIFNIENGLLTEQYTPLNMNLELAALGNTDLIRTNLRTASALGLQSELQDILITYDNQYHILRAFPKDPSLFFYAALDSSSTNLGSARNTIKQKINQFCGLAPCH